MYLSFPKIFSVVEMPFYNCGLCGILFDLEKGAICAPARGLRVTKRLFASKKSRKGGEGTISFTLCYHFKKKSTIVKQTCLYAQSQKTVKLIAPRSPLRDGRMPSGASSDAAARMRRHQSLLTFTLKNPFLPPSMRSADFLVVCFR